ncbi:MAG: hypothetical protein JWL72_4028 [Ilumatobacteraceae bacterium]|nr:hypothetical protein [Ilumatobacteraceae bacterium]
MLQHSNRVAGAMTATFSRLSRRTSWQLIDELPLAFDAHHPQGMARVGETWWVSTVDIANRLGFVLAVDRTGHLVEQVRVGDASRYHPGGMDFDGEAFWIAAAEYRPDSTAVIQRFVPGHAAEDVFVVDDHVGAVARCGGDGDLVGWSWGSRRFYRWSVDGTLLDSRTNPAHFVDHQDCQWLDTGHLLCGGVAEVSLADGPGWLGGIGVLDAATLTMAREVPFPHYSPATGRPGTHNPIWAEVDGDRLIVHLLPDDGYGAIRSYATPLVELTSS